MHLLDKAKELTGSDAETGRKIGMSKCAISDVRAGTRTLTPYQAAKLAELIGERWHDHALPALAAKAGSEAERQYWLGKSATLAQIAGKAMAGVFLIIIAAFPYRSGIAAESEGYSSPDYTLCA